MNSIRSSKLGGLALCLVLALALTGTAVAFDDSAQGLQDEYQVGSDAAVTYTLSDPFTDVPNQYTLEGETQLTNVSWTVEVYRAGSQISENTYGGQNFSQQLDVNNNGDEVRVKLEGTAPAVANFTYPEEETFLVAELTRVSGNNPTTFRTDRAHHYTEASKDARQAIADAEQAIEEAGGNAEAEELLANAKNAYRNEEAFATARNISQQAQTKANQAKNSAQQTQLILMVAGAVVVIGLLAGGFLYWRSQQDEYSKL